MAQKEGYAPYFTGATLFALVFGLVVGNLVQPGAGLNIDPATLSQDALNAKTATAPPKDAGAFLLGIIPTSVIGAFAGNNLLQVLCFSVFFGAAIVVVGRERCLPVITLMETVLELFFKIMAWVYPRVPLWQFMKYTREEFLLALGTASTESVLPRIRDVDCGQERRRCVRR